MPNATKTRREHLLELLPRLGMEQFGIKHYRAISAWLESTALQTTQGIVLAQTAVDELRRRLVVLPSLMVLERLCAEVATRAQRKIFAILTADLTATQRGGSINFSNHAKAVRIAHWRGCDFLRERPPPRRFWHTLND